MNVMAAFPVSRVPVVNVACVPQRSPLRYPGGKTWLVPHVREWLKVADAQVLIEPFAGGGVVSLTAVMEGLVQRVVMIELDREVAAFWRAALDHNTALRRRVEEFKPSRKRLQKILDDVPRAVTDRGFRTLALNRTRRGGILAPGASFSRVGENGKGVASRWYPDTISARLGAIREVADRIDFIAGDGLNLLSGLLRKYGRRAVVFADPPYTAKGGKSAGTRLYSHWELDHAKLFSVLAEHDCGFMMTYDVAPKITDLVREHGFHAVSLTMKGTHHTRLSEIVITREPIFS